MRRYGSVAAAIALIALAWRTAPAEALGLFWLASGLLILDLGLRGMPPDFRLQGYAVAVLGVLRLLLFNLPGLLNSGPWMPRFVPLAAALLAYALAARSRRDANGKPSLIASSVGTVLLLAAAWSLLPGPLVALAWASMALAFAWRRNWSEFVISPWSGQGVAALAFLRCWWTNLAGHDGLAVTLATGSIVIGCFYFAQLQSTRNSSPGPTLFWDHPHEPAAVLRNLRESLDGGFGDTRRGVTGIRLSFARTSLADLRPRIVIVVHPEALSVGSAPPGNAPAHLLLYRPGPDPGRGFLGLYAIPGAGGEILVSEMDRLAFALGEGFDGSGAARLAINRQNVGRRCIRLDVVSRRKDVSAAGGEDADDDRA